MSVRAGVGGPACADHKCTHYMLQDLKESSETASTGSCEHTSPAPVLLGQIVFNWPDPNI